MQVLANFLSTPLASEDDNLGLPYVVFDLNLGVVKVQNDIFTNRDCLVGYC